MKIHYVKNDWGRLMPIHFDKCCEAMTKLFSPEDTGVYRLARGEPRVIMTSPAGRTIKDNVTKCPFCDSPIECIKRELKEIERF